MIKSKNGIGKGIHSIQPRRKIVLGVKLPRCRIFSSPHGLIFVILFNHVTRLGPLCADLLMRRQDFMKCKRRAARLLQLVVSMWVMNTQVVSLVSIGDIWRERAYTSNINPFQTIRTLVRIHRFSSSRSYLHRSCLIFL